MSFLLLPVSHQLWQENHVTSFMVIFLKGGHLYQLAQLGKIPKKEGVLNGDLTYGLIQ